MGRDLGKLMNMFFMLLVVPGVILSSSSALAYTDEEINQAIMELNNKISSLKSAQDNSATVGGKVFISYTTDSLTKGVKRNLFDVTRAYLDFKKTLSRDASVRVTTDIERWITTEADTRYSVFLKYAYFDLGGLNVPYVGLNTLRVGQMQNHWIDFMEGFWTARYIAKPLTDQFGIFSSADLGLGGLGGFDVSNFAIPYLGRFDYYATLMNGTGYKAGETSANNYGKSLALRVSTNPILWGTDDKITTAIGMQVKDYPFEQPQHGTGSKVNYGKLEDVLTGVVAWNFTAPSNGIIFAEGFVKHGANGAATVESTGVSFGGQYEVVPDVVLLARADTYDPKTYLPNRDDLQTLLILGVQYNWGANVKLALDTQCMKNFAGTGGNVSSSTWNLHSEVKW